MQLVIYMTYVGTTQAPVLCYKCRIYMCTTQVLYMCSTCVLYGYTIHVTYICFLHRQYICILHMSYIALTCVLQTDLLHNEDAVPNAVWLEYKYRKARPILRWLPSKLAEYTGDNYVEELGIPRRQIRISGMCRSSITFSCIVQLVC